MKKCDCPIMLDMRYDKQAKEMVLILENLSSRRGEKSYKGEQKVTLKLHGWITPEYARQIIAELTTFIKNSGDKYRPGKKYIARNLNILKDYNAGMSVKELQKKYSLSRSRIYASITIAMRAKRKAENAHL